MTKDLYEILKVRNDSSNDFIHTNFKKLYLKYKNDLEKIKEITFAYSILKDENHRASYDYECELMSNSEYLKCSERMSKYFCGCSCGKH
jgi:curved DNA-binding protein CbpA